MEEKKKELENLKKLLAGTSPNNPNYASLQAAIKTLEAQIAAGNAPAPKPTMTLSAGTMPASSPAAPAAVAAMPTKTPYQAAYDKAIAEGKSAYEAQGIAEHAAAVAAGTMPAGFEGANESLQERQDTFVVEARKFAKDLGPKAKAAGLTWNYTDADIDKMTPEQLRKIVADNPKFAEAYFGRPTTSADPVTGATYTYGAGESGLIGGRPIGGGEKAAAVSGGGGGGGGDKVPPEPPKPLQKGEQKILQKIADENGINILDIINALGYTLGNVNKETMVEKKLAAKEERKKLDWEAEQKKQEREYTTEQSAIDRQFTATQKELDRLAQKELMGLQLSSEERREKMRLEAQKAQLSAAGAGATAPYVP